MKKSNQKYTLLAVIGFVLGGFFGLMNVEADNLAFSFLWGGLIIATAFMGAGWLFGSDQADGGCLFTALGIAICAAVISLSTGEWIIFLLAVGGMVLFLLFGVLPGNDSREI